MYKCECGREFEKAQSINAHYSRCKVHRGDKYVARKDYPFRNLSAEKRNEIHTKAGKTSFISVDRRKSMMEGLKRSPNRHKLGGYRKGSKRWKGEKYNGVWMDSSWEVRFVKKLDEFGIKWRKNFAPFEYEYDNVIRRYVPDFYLPEIDTWVEVKGWETEKDFFKWKDFPHKLSIVRGDKLAEIERSGSMVELVYTLG